MFISVQHKRFIEENLSEEDFKMWKHYNMWGYAMKLVGDFSSANAVQLLRDALTKDLYKEEK